jgi:GH35 family endo-1,4-beta-xylanase
MVWPRKCSVSNELAQLLKAEKPNKKLIERKILEHIRDIGAATSFCMDEWDVLNESIPCHDVQDICGDQVMIDWFKEARKVLPSKVKLALNEYSILSVLTDTEKISKHEDRIKYLLDGGAPLEVLGFQSHMGGAPPSPERIYRVLNRFSKFHLPIRATEYDIKSNDEDLIYDFTRDFLTIMFSHSSVIGVQMWTFDGFYDKDGQITTFGKAYQDLVLKKWKTVKNGRTDTKGIFSFRGYLGEYELQITVNGQKITKTFKLEKGDGTDNISIDI